MARVTLKEGTDVPKLKKALKKRGFVLREYKEPDGSKRYTLHRNPYLPVEAVLNMDALKELFNQ